MVRAGSEIARLRSAACTKPQERALPRAGVGAGMQGYYIVVMETQ